MILDFFLISSSLNEEKKNGLRSGIIARTMHHLIITSCEMLKLIGKNLF